jgi:O-antigen ligase
MGRAASLTGGDPPTSPPTAVDIVFLWALVLAVSAAVMGGASRENAIRLAAVELCALPLLCLAARRLLGAGRSRGAILPLVIVALLVTVPLIQLVPLPPAVWTVLPGQAPRIEALSLAGLPTPWLPMTLAPVDTGRAALALIPPAAMFLGVLCLRPGQTQRIAWLWIALAVLGLVFGVGQMASPDGGPAYLYATTNLGSLVGLFANRNHEAAFLLALTPVAAALALSTGTVPRRGEAPSPWKGAGPWAAGLFILIALVALGVIRSRAGIILVAPAVAGSLAVLWRGSARGAGRLPLVGIAMAVGVAALAVALFGLSPILDRFGGAAQSDVLAGYRARAWPYVVAAARTFLPLGSGLGSFDRVYQSVEPVALVYPFYFNHAHNDYLELWLETGWVGAAIFGLFCLWLAGATWRAWRLGGGLAPAASLSILLLMGASATDYPLRTETLAVLFAFCCGVLARPQGREAQRDARRQTGRRARP